MAFLPCLIETAVAIAALLAVMPLGFILLERAEQVAHELAGKLAKLWVPAELLLFVLIGLAVDLPTAASTATNACSPLSPIYQRP